MFDENFKFVTLKKNLTEKKNNVSTFYAVQIRYVLIWSANRVKFIVKKIVGFQTT